MRIGVFGGTFDPIHLGHLRMAEEAREHADLQRVLFVPNNVSPFKLGRTITPGAQRVEMVRLAVAENAAFAVNTSEVDRPAPSYTVDTLAAIKAGMPASAELFFLTGADAVRDLPKWREPERLLQMTRFLAAARPGTTEAEIVAALPAEWSPRIEFLRMPELDITSTDLRARVGEGRSIRYLTPPAVEAYIGEHRLYRKIQ